MDVHASEKEQVEALKKWWKENGSSVVTGVLLGLAALLGGKAWFSYQENQALSASNIYAQLMGASTRGAEEEVRNAANELIGNYSRSGYAPLAALLLARQAADAGELGAAEAQLRWALDNADTPELRQIARVRLVRTLIEQQKFAEAEQLLKSAGDAGVYDYQYRELEGDMALVQGQQERALTAYRQALDTMPLNAPDRTLLTAKYEGAGGGESP
jgi:predicted negative regulator of RcsB-dependent stress response